MGATMKALEYIGGFGLVICLALVLAKFQGNDILDPPTPPEPPQPIESPFPAEGFWLLVASQGADQAKLLVATNDIDDWPGLESRWHDYDQGGLPEPWSTALSWCAARSGEQPYYILRHGNKASEGPLTGSLQDWHDTVLKAVKEAS